MNVTIETELECVCDECGGWVDVTQDGKRLVIKPCDTCLEKAYSEGYIRAKDEDSE